MAGAPDPKPANRKRNRARRIEDADAGKRMLRAYPECAACGRRAESAHHVVRRGAPHFGDDLEENQVGLCGDGARGCHGAHHGNPYVVTLTMTGIPPGARLHIPDWARDLVGEALERFEETGQVDQRRDAQWVNQRIGHTLLTERPEVIEYVQRKLGDVAGAAYLERYGIALTPA